MREYIIPEAPWQITWAVKFTETWHTPRAIPVHRHDDLDSAWRVVAYVEGDPEDVCRVVGMKFGREEDAARAAAELVRRGIRTVGDVLRLGPEGLYRLMTECLAW
jgi:hypothetical protein